MLHALFIVGTAAVSISVAALVWQFSKETPSGRKLPPGTRRPVLLVCSTFHSRRKPVLHSFRYPVLYVGVDLDAADYVDNIFSASEEVWRPLSLRGVDYLGGKHAGSLKEKLWAHLKDHAVDTTDLSRAFLVTTPRLFGYSFNPVSFHFIYDSQDELKVVVLEVNNTFGEKHVYILQPDGSTDQVRRGFTMAQTFPRRFHVSPFNDRSGFYQLQCRDPFVGNEMKLDMLLTLLEEDLTPKLTAQVASTRSPIPTTETLRSIWTLLRYGGAVFLTTPRILVEAYKLHYVKKLAVYLRPEPYEDSGAIGRQAAGTSEQFFMDLVFDYLKGNTEWITCKRVRFDILPATSDHRDVVIQGGGDEGELLVTVLSYQFFTSLVTSESPLTSLWTDYLAMSSPLFRVSDQLLFLQVFSSGFSRALDGRFYFQRYRTEYRGRPAWFDERLKDLAPQQVEYSSLTNLGFDNHVYEMSLAGKRSLWRYRWRFGTALVSEWFANYLFGAIASFAGEAGRPGDEWLRVKMEFDRRAGPQRGSDSDKDGPRQVTELVI